MNNHNMKLRKEPYVCISNGTKNIELRLYDEKRQQIKLGDTIQFINQDSENDPILLKTVIGLLHYKTFEDIINDFNISVFGNREKNDLLNLLYTFYSKEDEKTFGVVGIRII